MRQVSNVIRLHATRDRVRSRMSMYERIEILEAVTEKLIDTVSDLQETLERIERIQGKLVRILTVPDNAVANVASDPLSTEDSVPSSSSYAESPQEQSHPHLSHSPHSQEID